MPALRVQVRHVARDAHPAQGTGISLRRASRVEGKNSPSSSYRITAPDRAISVAARSLLGTTRHQVRDTYGDRCDARLDNRAAHAWPEWRPSRRGRGARQSRAIADGRASDGRRLNRSAYGEAMVQW